MTTSLELLKAWAGNPTNITDGVFQSLLDGHAQTLVERLTADAGSLTFRSTFTAFLAASLEDEAGVSLTPSAVDLAAGVWTFTTIQDYVRVKGTVADVHAAAADAWAMRLAMNNTWKGDFARGAREMIRYHQARSFASSVETVRDDVRDALPTLIREPFLVIP